jgi:hypothetical protein
LLMEPHAAVNRSVQVTPMHLYTLTISKVQVVPLLHTFYPQPFAPASLAGVCVRKRAGGGSSSDTEHTGGGAEAAGGLTACTQDTGLCSSSGAAQVVCR